MGDGYFHDKVIMICTDNSWGRSPHEVLLLIKVLDEKFGIKATISKRNNPNGNIV